MSQKKKIYNYLKAQEAVFHESYNVDFTVEKDHKRILIKYVTPNDRYGSGCYVDSYPEAVNLVRGMTLALYAKAHS